MEQGLQLVLKGICTWCQRYNISPRMVFSNYVVTRCMTTYHNFLAVLDLFKQKRRVVLDASGCIQVLVQPVLAKECHKIAIKHFHMPLEWEIGWCRPWKGVSLCWLELWLLQGMWEDWGLPMVHRFVHCLGTFSTWCLLFYGSQHHLDAQSTAH